METAMRRKVTHRLLSGTIYVMTTLLGVMAFLYPFWLPSLAQGDGLGMAHAADAPLMMTLLVGLCFAVLLLEVQGNGMSAKALALLGILVAMNSVLRFAEAAIPGPGGFSPIFLLIVLGGYVYGARFGFLLGALTMFVSGLLTGGIGPWLPYQMFVAGWTGMAAPLCRPVVRVMQAEGRWGEVWALAIYAGIWGLVFGMVMNIWFWPFIAGAAEYYWSPGISVLETIRRYLVFYAVTSLVWDAMRMAGNLALILAFGMPVLRVLRRFHDRFTYAYVPVAGVAGGVSPAATGSKGGLTCYGEQVQTMAGRG
jgi:energy-coupling factor transport system substrate-specific component